MPLVESMLFGASLDQMDLTKQPARRRRPAAREGLCGLRLPGRGSGRSHRPYQGRPDAALRLRGLAYGGLGGQ
ncbi:hypothetical protein ACRAWD_02260 [Caulobacter segnis]